MKKIVSLIIALTIVLGASAKTYVLVTAVSTYQQAENNVTQTTKNAKSFAKKMRTQTEDVSILTSSYANHDNVLAKLKAICKGATKNDQIIFFFAGHGGADTPESGCIYAYDKPIYYTELMKCFNGCKAPEKVMLIEACHSGSSLKSYIKNGVVCLASSRMDEYSYYHNILGAGYFSNALLLGIQGKADANKDKKITISELYKYIYSSVVGRSQQKQHPQLITTEAGKNIVIFDCNKL